MTVEKICPIFTVGDRTGIRIHVSLFTVSSLSSIPLEMICIHNILVVLSRDIISKVAEKSGVLHWLNELGFHNCDWPNHSKGLAKYPKQQYHHDLEYTVTE